MSSGGSKTKITDYLMSMQFGICKGRLDQINTIFIKELPVWCGLMKSSQNVKVDLPELFGGDESEGGPAGTIECYFGGATQMMSEAVATRMDATPTTMPGYRGIANIFLRAAAKGGFKWTTNNPYIPATWVNATRLPKSLSADFSVIYPYDADYQQVNDVTVPIAGSTTLSLVQLGVTLEDVDAGKVTLTSILSSTISFSYGDKGPAPGILKIKHSFYRDAGEESEADPSGIVGSKIGPTQEAGPGSFSGTASATLVRVLPAGTRFVKIDPDLLATFPISTNFVNTHSDKISFPSHNGGWCGKDGSLTVLPQANPAHMIYEALNDRDWGMGNPRNGFDIPSFMQAAETLFNEKFGLSILWSEQSEIEKYVSEILDHIQASLFVDPASGLWRLELYRKDYEVNDLLVLDPSNCKVTDRQRKGYGEVINEVVISWTNPENEKDETVTFQDPASISTQGLVSSTRNYYGVRSVELANKLGARDIRAAAYPTFMCNVIALRDLSNIFPGSVVRLNWPEDGIVGMVLRVGKVDYGKPGDKYIRFPATEDIYGLKAGEYTSVQKTGWKDPNVPPTPMDQLNLMTAPLSLFVRGGRPMSQLSDSLYPVVPVAILGNRASNDSISSFDVVGPVVKANGEVVQGTITTLNPTPVGLTSIELFAEAQTTMHDDELTRFCGYYGPTTGTFLVFGQGDYESEIVMLDSFNAATGQWTLARGMYDTVPRNWIVGTLAWFVGDSIIPIDPSERANDVEAVYRFRPKSGGGKLPLADAPIERFTPSDRPYCPIRPANVAVVATGSGAVVTPFPVKLANASAETHSTLVPTAWTQDRVNSVNSLIFFSPNYTVSAQSGSRFFKFGGTIGYDAYMEQILSIPVGMVERIDTGAWPINVQFYRAAMKPDEDHAKVTIQFYDASDVLIGSFDSGYEFAATQTWEKRRMTTTVPALTRSYKLRFDVQKTDGTTTDFVIDNITVDLAKGQWPILAFVGTEVPTGLDFTWSARNRLMEDRIAPRWGAATITPEAGQSVTIRCREKFSRAIEFQATGITGTSYSLDVSSLTGYRFYDIEILSVRDGFESIQFFSQPFEVQRLGYGNNYGFDYGQNNGA